MIILNYGLWHVGKLRVLTHYNRPIYKRNIRTMNKREAAVVAMLQQVTLLKEKLSIYLWSNMREPLCPLSPWITYLLLEAPLGIRSDYFCWCGGVMGIYAALYIKFLYFRRHCF